MNEHLTAKLVTTIAAVIGVVVAAVPGEILPISGDQVEAWARFGVAGGCLLIVLVGLFYTIPKLTRDHREAINQSHSYHERTIDRICTSHAASMHEMRAEQRDDGQTLGKQMERLATSVDSMRDAIHEEGKLQRNLQHEQIKQLSAIKEQNE